jgi:hypothetical protein
MKNPRALIELLLCHLEWIDLRHKFSSLSFIKSIAPKTAPFAECSPILQSLTLFTPYAREMSCLFWHIFDIYSGILLPDIRYFKVRIFELMADLNMPIGNLSSIFYIKILFTWQ